MNTIIVPYEDIQDEHETYESGFIFNEFILGLARGRKAHEVLIRIEDENSWFSGKIYAVPIFGKEKDSYLLKIWYLIKVAKTGEIVVHMTPMVDDMPKKEIERYINIGHDYGEQIVRALITIMEKIENRNKIVKESMGGRAKPQKQVKNAKRGKDNRVFLLDDLVEYVTKNNIYPKHSVHHSIQCPCWSVRGHYRTYKSGKTVFVKPYRKGKKRETAEPKENIYIV